MEPPPFTCASCGNAVGDTGPTVAAGDQVVCDACRRAVSGLEPRRVLPYAGHGGRRRWSVWATVVAAVAAAVLLTAVLFTARTVAVERARAAQMRALAAQQAAVAAAAAQTRPAATRPGE